MNINIVIPYNKIDLKKCTKQGLELMMDILMEQESYEWAAQVRDEMKHRNEYSPKNSEVHKEEQK